MGNSAGDLVLCSASIEAAVSARFGGSVTRVRHRASGVDVLWHTPWADSAAEPPAGEALGVEAWCDHSRGGWQVALPNAGDDVMWRGTRHGFHGEASMAAWEVVTADPASVTLALELTTMPVRAERRITVAGETVTVEDSLANLSDAPVELMWTQHPGLGGDLLGGPVTIATNARTVDLDVGAAVVGADVAPGQAGAWPHVGGTDFRHPREGTAMLGYLHEFDGDPWVTVTRDDGSIGVRLSWEAATYPHCWLWEELGGTAGPPWNGLARVIGVEPATSWPGRGLATVAATTRTAYRIDAYGTATGAVTLSVAVPAESDGGRS